MGHCRRRMPVQSRATALAVTIDAAMVADAERVRITADFLVVSFLFGRQTAATRHSRPDDRANQPAWIAPNSQPYGFVPVNQPYRPSCPFSSGDGPRRMRPHFAEAGR